MPGRTAATERLLWRPIARLDAWLNRLYSWRHNPLYQSGALAVLLMVVITVTGLYLLVFYRIGAPYESVARITGQAWTGRWIRSLHRYASDAAVVAIAFHALRIFAQGRAWGPRALAWVSGAFLLFVVFLCGWTGYVMVWDVQGELLAVEGARLLDALPIFAEPISRAFVGENRLPNAFFFLNLFFHIALPIGLGVLIWLHVARVARPTLLPPRRLLWGTLGLLFLLSILWPIAMAPEADPFRLPGTAPLDLFYSFWLPAARAVPASGVWLIVLAITALLLAVPLLARPGDRSSLRPSKVDETHCTGCEQCYLDCPYEAIAMVSIKDRGTPVARVDPALCVSCGICAGSCAPMRVGPPRRTGRDQLAVVRAFLERQRPSRDDVVLVACQHSPVGGESTYDGAPVYRVSCAGAVHSSVLEYLLRDGGAGVMVVACPPRDCWSREGARWTEERMYNDREAELQERVDRDRVRLVYAATAERSIVRRELAAFRDSLARPGEGDLDAELDLIRRCETVEEEVGR